MPVAIAQSRLKQCFLPLHRRVSKHLTMQIKLLGFLLWVATAGTGPELRKLQWEVGQGGREKL